METIALFGGSFDPPHIGHEAVVKALLKIDKIDKIVVMPTFLNPFKSAFYAPAALRLKWLRKIFAPYEKVEVSSFEVEQNEKVPTYKTVQELQKRYAKIYVVIGADNQASLQKWYRYEDLCKTVTFIVATRDEIAVSERFETLQIDVSISSSELRRKIDITKLPKNCAKEIYEYYKEKNAKQN